MLNNSLRMRLSILLMRFGNLRAHGLKRSGARRFLHVNLVESPIGQGHLRWFGEWPELH